MTVLAQAPQAADHAADSSAGLKRLPRALALRLR